MRIAYFGSSGFSVPPLASILPTVACVVTRKAKPKGRGHHVEGSEVKEVALGGNIPVIEIDSFKDEEAQALKEMEIDLFVVASFGLIIPRWALLLPSIGPLNIHPSLLPRYRGPSPIQWALWNGESETGITFIRMNERMDEGNILLQVPVAIEPEENVLRLSDRLSAESAALLPPFIRQIEEKGMEEGIVQDPDQATYTPIINKEMGKIDWNLGALEVTRQVRALAGWPVAYTSLGELVLKVHEARVEDPSSVGESGRVAEIRKDGFLVSTPHGSVLVSEVQLENKKRMKAYQFAQGYRGLSGACLGG